MTQTLDEISVEYYKKPYSELNGNSSRVVVLEVYSDQFSVPESKDKEIENLKKQLEIQENYNNMLVESLEDEQWIDISQKLPLESGKYLFYTLENKVPIVDFFIPTKKDDYLKKYYTHWKKITSPIIKP